MHNLGTHFDCLLDNLKPPQERRDAARELPSAVRHYLKECGDFETISPHTHLVGSYAQHLSVGDIKDVDILIRVDGEPEVNDPVAKQVIIGLRTALADFPYWEKLPSWVRSGGSASLSVKGARRSVHLYFANHDFHLDIVPCIAPNGFSEQLWVPDRNWNEWVPSHPVGVLQLIQTLNDAHGKKVRPLGKLIKHFRNYHMLTKQPKSYWLLSVLLDQVQNGNLDSNQPIGVVFHDLLNAIYNKYASLIPRTDGATPNISDPILDHNVSWNWQRSHFETFMRRLDDGRRWTSKAIECDDKSEAIECWQKVFGEDYFPSDISQYASTLANAGWPGAAAVSGTGRIISGHRDSNRFTPIQPTTFHSDANE